MAAGEADAIRSVYGAITESGTDDRVIAIKYLEALQGIADGRATKIFVPAEMGATLGTLGGIAEMLRNGDFPPASPSDHDRDDRPSARDRQPERRPIQERATTAPTPRPAVTGGPSSAAARPAIDSPTPAAQAPPALPPSGTAPPPPMRR